jgi:hypothetical protein
MSGSANALVHIDSGARGRLNRSAIFCVDERVAASPPELILGLKIRGLARSGGWSEPGDSRWLARHGNRLSAHIKSVPLILPDACGYF